MVQINVLFLNVYIIFLGLEIDSPTAQPVHTPTAQPVHTPTAQPVHTPTAQPVRHAQKTSDSGKIIGKNN